MQDDDESSTPEKVARKDSEDDAPPKKKTKIDDFFKAAAQKKDDTGNTSGYVREGRIYRKAQKRDFRGLCIVHLICDLEIKGQMGHGPMFASHCKLLVCKCCELQVAILSL